MFADTVDALSSVTQTVTSGSLFLAIPLALAAGLISFLSPCVLPLVPGYLSYITGLTGAEIASEDGQLDARGRSRIVIGCALFVAGFSVVFVALGVSLVNLILQGVAVIFGGSPLLVFCLCAANT